MIAEQLILREIRMPLVHFFETSFSRTYERRILLIELVSGGVSGWGEITCGENPFYNEEWTDSAWPLVKNYCAPRVLRHEFATADEVYGRMSHIRGHFMTRGGVETAFWDLEARQTAQPLYRLIGGGAHMRVPCGVSIGVQDSIPQLLEKIRVELEAGYRRIKIKIKPGWDVAVIKEVRREYPSILLMADANSAYTLADIDRLKRLDDFNLMMIEQPLAHDDFVDHAKLQAQLRTPICLDECIRTPHQAEQAIAMDAGRIINIKLGRVGGFGAAKRVHDIAERAGIPVWCGGMLESGIGRAHNIALSSLANFVLPGDVSASKRYWKRDIVQPEVEVASDGTIAVPEGIGFGYEIDIDYLKTLTVREETIQ